LLAKHRVKIRFVIIGIWNTIFGYSVFFGLDTLFVRLMSRRYAAYLAAMALSNVLAILNAYVFHKYITFKSAEKGSSLIIEFLRFCLTYVGTFLLSLVLLPVSVEFFRLTPKLAAALVILACVIISYVGHSKFSFKNS
jgi:putative flippase GtrA